DRHRLVGARYADAHRARSTAREVEAHPGIVARAGGCAARIVSPLLPGSRHLPAGKGEFAAHLDFGRGAGAAQGEAELGAALVAVIPVAAQALLLATLEGCCTASRPAAAEAVEWAGSDRAG